MAVLVEGISVIVRRDAVEEKLGGGWERFRRLVPNLTFCHDQELARVGFMSPPDVEVFLRLLVSEGLVFLQDGKALDIAVVDQVNGATVTVEWLEIARLPVNDRGDTVAACWLFEGPRMGYGTHLPSLSMKVATPVGWVYEESLSASFQFVPNQKVESRLKFLRHQDGIDVYLDLDSGEEVFMGRTS